MPSFTHRAGSALRAAGRGLVAAQAMSGLRQVTTGLDLVGDPPPEAVLRHTAPGLLRRVPVRRRRALVELVHWSYGAAGGLLFGGLPTRLRRTSWVGPVYGFLFWAGFQAGIAPLVGIAQRKGVREQLALLADHLLYGAVVASARWPAGD